MVVRGISFRTQRDGAVSALATQLLQLIVQQNVLYPHGWHICWRIFGAPAAVVEFCFVYQLHQRRFVGGDCLGYVGFVYSLPTCIVRSFAVKSCDCTRCSPPSTMVGIMASFERQHEAGQDNSIVMHTRRRVGGQRKAMTPVAGQHTIGAGGKSVIIRLADPYLRLYVGGSIRRRDLRFTRVEHPGSTPSQK